MSIIDDITTDGDSQETLEIVQDGTVRRTLRANILWASEKGFYLFVQGVSLALDRDKDGSFILNVTKELLYIARERTEKPTK